MIICVRVACEVRATTGPRMGKVHALPDLRRLHAEADAALGEQVWAKPTLAALKQTLALLLHLLPLLLPLDLLSTAQVCRAARSSHWQLYGHKGVALRIDFAGLINLHFPPSFLVATRYRICRAARSHCIRSRAGEGR